MARILIAGCGYLGARLGLDLARAGHDVFAVRRRATSLPDALHAVAADLTDPRDVESLPWPFDTICYTAAAGAPTPEAYTRAYVSGPELLIEASTHAGRVPPRFVFCSSTSVYGEHAGEWVDEGTPARPSGFRGEVVLRGEEAVRARTDRAVCVRLGGIYGPGRTRLIESVRSGQAASIAVDAYTNRIHRDDATRVLAHLLAAETPDDTYNAVDREPALRSEVNRWIAAHVGAAPAALPAPGTPIEGKRCRCDRLIESGFSFLYPSFREGYGSLIGDGAESLLRGE